MEQNGQYNQRLSRRETRKKARRRKLKIVLGVIVLIFVSSLSALGYMAAIQHWLSGGPPADGDRVPAETPNPPHSAPHSAPSAPPDAVPPDTDTAPERLRLMFVGDTMMDGNVAKVMLEKGDTYPLSEFMPILQQADLVVANLETAVGTSRRLAEKTYAFQTDPARFALFVPLQGRLLFSLANNHSMDAPLEETIAHLERMGYPYVGVGRNRDEAFRPYVSDINGVKIAILGASRVIPTADWAAGDHRPGMASAYTDEPLLGAVRHWSRQVDHVIVFVHWGKERAAVPDAIQRQLAEKLLDAGARIIVGAHPHVLQEFHWTPEGQLIAYSLGNFVFTTSTDPAANDTAVLDITLTKEDIAQVRVWPGNIQFGLIRYLPANDPERPRLLQRLNELSPTICIDADGHIHPLH